MKYYIVNNQNIALSTFCPNDQSGNSQLHFNRGNAYVFPTPEKAESFVNYVQARSSGKSKIAALKLRISTSAIGW